MPRETFDYLELLCACQGIVCERTGKRIDLTTPDGSVTANCDNLAEAFDTVRNDPTFAKLPIKLAKAAPAELYEYEFRDEVNVKAIVRADTLNGACHMLRKDKPFRVIAQFAFMAVVEFTDGETWGITWKRI